MKKARIEMQDLLDYLALELREWIKRTGHSLTGKLERSTEGKLAPAGLSGEVLWEEYGETINSGINRRRIPYSPGSGARSSQYIEGLLRFVRLRGLRPRAGQTIRGIAFAIARTQKEVGSPTPGSRRFSQTGRRTGFVQEMLQAESKSIQEGFEDVAEALLVEELERILNTLVGSGRFIFVT